MSLPVLILGAGGHARVLLDALLLCSRQVVGILDADPELKGKLILGVPVLGGDREAGRFGCDEVELVNGIGSVGSLTRRAGLFKEYLALGYRFASVVHPAAVLARDVELGMGAQVMAGAVLQVGARIGANSIVNTRAAVDHDCRIGSHVHLAPGVTLSGGVVVEDEVHIGTGATVIQGVSIARGSTVGAGALVLRNVKEGVTVFGVPAREAQR